MTSSLQSYLSLYYVLTPQLATLFMSGFSLYLVLKNLVLFEGGIALATCLMHAILLKGFKNTIDASDLEEKYQEILRQVLMFYRRKNL